MNVYPAIAVMLICLAAYRWGAWRRANGRPFTLREGALFVLAVPAVMLPILVLPAVFASSGLSPSWRAARACLVVAIGFAPLLLGSIFIWTFDRLTRSCS